MMATTFQHFPALKHGRKKCRAPLLVPRITFFSRKPPGKYFFEGNTCEGWIGPLPLKQNVCISGAVGSGLYAIVFPLKNMFLVKPSFLMLHGLHGVPNSKLSTCCKWNVVRSSKPATSHHQCLLHAHCWIPLPLLMPVSSQVPCGLV